MPASLRADSNHLSHLAASRNAWWAKNPTRRAIVRVMAGQRAVDAERERWRHHLASLASTSP